jgi:RNase P subunit RPR2
MDHRAGGESPEESTSVLTCPGCGVETEERMPENACVVRWTCPACGAEIRPLSGDCCVFCSYGSRPCPPERASGGC